MNQRIRELAREAGFYANPDVEKFEKFAELLVRECVHVAVYKEDGMISTADVAGYMAAGRASAAKIIKQHFGVEE